MKKMNNTVSIILGIVTVVFLVGSFPVKHYFGQEYCDVMRIVGWVALIVFWIYYWVCSNKASNEHPVDSKK